MRGVDSKIVAVQIARIAGPVFKPRHPSKEDTRFPVSLEDARRPPYQLAYGAPPLREIRIWTNGFVTGWIYVWIGLKASPQDRKAVARAIRSIRDESCYRSLEHPPMVWKQSCETQVSG
jgi:hypothetical protein